jgi:hypothetical protein
MATRPTHALEALMTDPDLGPITLSPTVGGVAILGPKAPHCLYVDASGVCTWCSYSVTRGNGYNRRPLTPPELRRLQGGHPDWVLLLQRIAAALVAN